MNEYITIRETLEYRDLPTELKTWVISDEVIEGIRTPIIFSQLLAENDLIGKIGRSLVFPVASQLGASAWSTLDHEENPEKALADSGFQVADKTITHVKIDVTELVYCATELSDILSEDFPTIDWTRLMLRNMGMAIGEYLEVEVRDLFDTGYGRTHSCATLTYDELIDAMATFKNASWMPDPANPPYLIISPDAEAVLLKDTKFITTERYTSGQVATMVKGEQGRYAGLRVLVSPLLDDSGDAFIKFPERQYGTIGTIVWKRRLRTKSERDETNETTFIISSVRYGIGIVQSGGLMRIQISSSP